MNDLPTLANSGVTVTSFITASGAYQYNITFNSNFGKYHAAQKYINKNFIFDDLLGDAPDITETTGNVNFLNTEIVKGIPTQSKIQLNIQNAWSKLFDIVNDPIVTVNYSIVLRYFYN